MDGCSLGDEVKCVLAPSAATEGSGDGGHGAVEHKPIFRLLAQLFPMLNTLDLSYNTLTRLTYLEELFFPSSATPITPVSGSPAARGLKILRLKGNKVADLNGLVEIGERFRRGGASGYGVEGWKGETIDISDNEISKLPAVLGILPLEVFLVEGNLFRVPARRVWERDGTKGLLKWLRDGL
jgi:hypothetical protein